MRTRQATTDETVESGVPALEVQDLQSGYDGTTVLRGVSLTVQAGSVVALVGPNGVGKTTLLRTVSGLITADAGRVLLDGADVTGMRPHRLAERGLCHVPEGRGVFRSLSVKENIILQSAPGTEDEALERAVEAFPPLKARLDQAAGTMSGGEQQMLAIAQAYVREPRLVMVDEASLGLAPLVVDIIFEFLGRLADSGASILIVDQFVTRALDMADYVYVMSRGEIASHGPADTFDEEALFRHYLGADTAPAQ